MLPEVLVILLSTITTCYTTDENNEVIIAPSSTKSPINLDTNLRKALLKALVELENEEKENHQRETRNDYVNIITHLDSKDKTIEKASASTVSFFSRPEPVNMTITVKKTTSKPKQSVFIQKSRSTQKTIQEFEDLNVSDTPEQIIASASNSFTSAKSENSKLRGGGAQVNSLTTKEKNKKSKFEQITTIKPTSSTEESEANVESLQFFSAPLVAAFTVHQDEKGLPKSVVPIYNQANIASNIGVKEKEVFLKNQEELQREVSKQKKELEARHEEDLRNKQLRLEKEIERLTKLKEQQEKLIREQKLIYEQKFLEQQKKLLEEQTRSFNTVQPSVASTTTTPKPIFSSNSNNFRSASGSAGTFVAIQPSIGFVQPTTQAAQNFLPQNAQILPIKNAVDFKTPFPQLFEQFKTIIPEPRKNLNSQSFTTRTQTSFIPSISLNTIPNQIVPSFSSPQNTAIFPLVNTAQNPNLFQSLPSTQITSVFHQVPIQSQNVFGASQHLPFQAPQNIPFRSSPNTSPSHGTRSLRQESGTGNFVNNRFNAPDLTNNFLGQHRFNTNSFPSQQHSQFPRNNFGFSNPSNFNQYQYNTLQYSVDQPFLKQRFNNLLSHTGLGQDQQQENLNIVSNVLSLNHLGTDSQTPNTNDNLKRIRNPASWRVV